MRVHWEKIAAKVLSELRRDDRRLAERIERAVEAFATTGAGDVKRLADSPGTEPVYRLRVAQWRVLFEVDQEDVVILVLFLGHRRDVCARFSRRR